MQIENQEERSENESDPYFIFLYAIRSEITKDYYLRRLRICFNHLNLLPDRTMKERCNEFASKGLKDPKWALHCIIRFMQFQRERVERQEITAATLRNFLKAIKLFCEMSDIPISWKKINRGLPKIRRFADDRAPTIEEIQKIFIWQRFKNAYCYECLESVLDSISRRGRSKMGRLKSYRRVIAQLHPKPAAP